MLTQPDRPVGRGLQLQASPVKRFASTHGLPLFQTETLASRHAVERINAARADALIVAAYGLILPQAILDLPRYGALNIHASLLPRWRGAAPIQRAILAGDRETGISIMQMDAGLDTGPVLARTAIEIAGSDDAGTLHDKLAVLGAQMMVETLQRMATDAIKAQPQPAEGATYARKVGKDEAMVDWQRPAIEIERAVRAFRPSPGASTRLDGEVLKIWQARVRDEHGAPGILRQAGPDALVIGCGEQSLEIVELQRQGGRRMPVREFLRGHAISDGTRLG